MHRTIRQIYDKQRMIVTSVGATFAAHASMQIVINQPEGEFLRMQSCQVVKVSLAQQSLQWAPHFWKPEKVTERFIVSGGFTNPLLQVGILSLRFCGCPNTQKKY
jgi:hypothetical protein